MLESIERVDSSPPVEAQQLLEEVQTLLANLLESIVDIAA